VALPPRPCPYTMMCCGAPGEIDRPDLSKSNACFTKGNCVSEIRKHLIPAVRKGGRNQQEGAENETEGVLQRDSVTFAKAINS
jgi:hypothetical protein